MFHKTFVLSLVVTLFYLFVFPMTEASLVQSFWNGLTFLFNTSLTTVPAGFLPKIAFLMGVWFFNLLAYSLLQTIGKYAVIFCVIAMFAMFFFSAIITTLCFAILAFFASKFLFQKKHS